MIADYYVWGGERGYVRKGVMYINRHHIVSAKMDIHNDDGLLTLVKLSTGEKCLIKSTLPNLIP